MIAADAGLPIERDRRGGYGVAVFVQDQTTGILDLPLVRELGVAGLATDTVVGNYTITLESGHGVTVGNTIEVADTTNGSWFVQSEVLSVAGDVIKLDTPINRVYTVNEAVVRVSSRLMNVDGSVTPVVFRVKPNINQSGDIVRLIIAMTDNATMDFETFGGIPKLARGVVVRVKNSDGTYRVIQNFKSNGEIERYSFDVRYFENSGGSTRGFSARMTFAGQDKHGAAIRLDGSLGESLELVVQDDLTGLQSMNWMAQGSELQD